MPENPKAARNHKRLDQALDRVADALEAWAGAYELLNAQDLLDDNLIGELEARLEGQALLVDRDGAWLRQHCRDRMN